MCFRIFAFLECFASNAFHALMMLERLRQGSLHTTSLVQGATLGSCPLESLYKALKGLLRTLGALKGGLKRPLEAF